MLDFKPAGLVLGQGKFLVSFGLITVQRCITVLRCITVQPERNRECILHTNQTAFKDFSADSLFLPATRSLKTCAD